MYIYNQIDCGNNQSDSTLPSWLHKYIYTYIYEKWKITYIYIYI